MGVKYTCPLCSEEMDMDMVKYMSHMKEEILKKVREDHPDWDPSKGICPKCKEHLDSWFDLIK